MNCYIFFFVYEYQFWNKTNIYSLEQYNCSSILLGTCSKTFQTISLWKWCFYRTMVIDFLLRFFSNKWWFNSSINKYKKIFNAIEIFHKMSIWNVIYLIRFFFVFYLLYFTDFVHVSYRSQVLLYCLCDNVDFLFYFFIIV